MLLFFHNSFQAGCYDDQGCGLLFLIATIATPTGGLWGFGVMDRASGMHRRTDAPHYSGTEGILNKLAHMDKLRSGFYGDILYGPVR